MCPEDLTEGGVLLGEVAWGLCDAGEVGGGVRTRERVIHGVQLCVCVWGGGGGEGGEGGRTEQAGMVL